MWWDRPNVFTWGCTIGEVVVGLSLVAYDWRLTGGIIIGLAMGAQFGRITRELFR